MTRRILPLLLLAYLVACGPSESQESTPSPTPASAAARAAAQPASADASRAEAEQIFATRCFTCHGPSGAGDGPGSVGLTPQPRNFQDPAWQDSVTDTHLEQIVMYGGAAVNKSPAMPGNPDLTAKAEVVRALVAHIRSLRGKS